MASELMPGVCNAVVLIGDSFDVGLVALDRSLHFCFLCDRRVYVLCDCLFPMEGAALDLCAAK